MGFLDDLISEAEDFWDAPVEEVARENKTAVTSDVFDRMTWASVNDQAPNLSLARLELAEEFPTSPELLEDVFNLLRQGDPLFRDRASMEEDYLGNHAVSQELFTQPEFLELRQDTKHDEYATAFTMLTLTEALREALSNMQEAQEAQEALAEALRDARAAQGGEGQGEAAQALQQALDAAQAAQQQTRADAQAIAVASKGAHDELKEDDRTARGYGLGAGQLQKMSFEERRQLMARLRKSRMDHLAKLIGSFRSFGDAERRRKIKHAPSEVHDYRLSNDLTKLVPEELNNLAIPELEEQFWLRHHQHALLTRELRGPDRAGQGPIIVVCDESGSMGSDLDGNGNTCEAWSKAVALALADQAKRGRRDFHYIGFASARTKNDLREHHFPNGQAPVDDLMDFVEGFLNGGTRFDVPLMRAAEIIEEYERGHRNKPDIVFITDGQAPLTEEFVKEWHALLDRLDAKCYGIQVGGNQASPTLKAVSHRTLTINRLNANPEGVQELFRSL